MSEGSPGGMEAAQEDLLTRACAQFNLQNRGGESISLISNDGKKIAIMPITAPEDLLQRAQAVITALPVSADIDPSSDIEFTSAIDRNGILTLVGTRPTSGIAASDLLGKIQANAAPYSPNSSVERPSLRFTMVDGDKRLEITTDVGQLYSFDLSSLETPTAKFHISYETQDGTNVSVQGAQFGTARKVIGELIPMDQLQG